jgi:hypothetical protein
MPRLLLLLIALIGIISLVVGSEPTETLCDVLREKKHMSASEAKEHVGPWFENQHQEWDLSHKQDEPRFWTWFTLKYAPSVADSIIECKLSGTCSVSLYDVHLEKHANTFFSEGCQL